MSISTCIDIAETESTLHQASLLPHVIKAREQYAAILNFLDLVEHWGNQELLLPLQLLKEELK